METTTTREFEGYTLKQHHTPTRDTYTANETNSKGERLTVALIQCTTPTGKNGKPLKDSIPALWKKHGQQRDILTSYWHAETEVTDANGTTRRDYNPQETPTHQINHDYIKEATEANARELMSEIYKRFINA